MSENVKGRGRERDRTSVEGGGGWIDTIGEFYHVSSLRKFPGADININ